MHAKRGNWIKGQYEKDSVYSPWKLLYISLCLALLAFTIYQFLMFLPEVTTGWDYRVYVSAVQAYTHYQDPYILENVAQYQLFNASLVFNYPPHTLFFFCLLDMFQIFHSIALYYILLLVLLVISAYLILGLDDRPHYLFLATVLLSGFISLSWNFLTGNSAIFFLLLFALAFMFWVKEKFWQSAIVLGLSAAISLFTAPFIGLFLFIRRPIRERFIVLSISAGTVASLFVIDYLIDPGLMISYLFRMRGPASPFNYSGGWNQPTPYLLFQDLLSSIWFDNLLPVILVSCCYIALILYAVFKYSQNKNASLLNILSIAMIAIYLILPYLKPYDFIILVIPVYCLFKDSSYQMKILVLSVISLLPGFIWLSPALGINDENLPFLLGSYVQTYSLILLFLIAILNNYLETVFESRNEGGMKTNGKSQKRRKSSDKS